jgi:predicted O-methyltransferase YrrM
VDPGFTSNLNEALQRRSSPSLRGKYDLIFLQIDHPQDLELVANAAEHLQPAGGLWVFHPKGKGASPSDSQVRACGLAAGLVDNKICAYNATHTATRYVIPRSAR